MTELDVSDLRSALAVRAAREGLLDVAYDLIDSPFGPLLACTTTAGVLRLAFATEDHDAILQQVSERVSPRVLRSTGRLDPVRRELDEYFVGSRQAFDVTLDWSLSTGFRRLALEAVTRVPYGSTATYAQVADSAGNPRAVRATGSACATNPLPIIVPCHRVLRTGGGLGGYLGGLAAKQALLALELSQEDKGDM